MIKVFGSWRRFFLCVLLVGFCGLGTLYVSLLLLDRYLDPFDDEPFDRSAWMSGTPKDRAKMGHDVIAKHIRRGMVQGEISDLLGKPNQINSHVGNRIDGFGNRLKGVKTYIYGLGSWSLYGLDDAFLYVHFDEDDRVVSADVAGG